MKTNYQYHHKKTLSFFYFGKCISFTYEHVDADRYMICLNSNQGFLKELELTNPFTLFLPVGRDYHYLDNDSEEKKEVHSPEQLAFFVMLDREINRWDIHV